MDTLTSDSQTLTWDFDSAEFALPSKAGHGRMQQSHLSNGFILYRSEFQVNKPCVIDTTSNHEQSKQLLSSQMLLSGRVMLETADKKTYINTTQHALLFRIVVPGTRIHLPGNQVVRHVGVAAPLETVLNSASNPGKLAHFAAQELDTAVVQEVKVRSRLRKMLADLFTGSYEGPIGQLGREGLALTIYAELLNEYLKTKDSPYSPTTLWEKAAFEDIVSYFRESLDKPLPIERLTTKFGVNRYRLEKLFLSELNCSLGEFLRRERMLAARNLIESEGLPPKSVAYQVGYNHVSNFSRAYRQYFGETPGQTLKLSNISKTTIP